MDQAKRNMEDTTFHACDLNSKILIQISENFLMLTIKWCESIYMKLNNNKYPLVISGYKDQVMWVSIG